MGKIIGIDLGTTNSVVSFMGPNGPEIILSKQGDRILPSLVAFTNSGEVLIGNPAKSQMVLNQNTVYSVKRLMGKKFSEVEPYLHQFQYNIVQDTGDKIKIKVEEDLYSPEEISSMIVRKLKESAEEKLKEPIDGAIITVPAYFNDSQRQATRDAGEIAGLNVLRIINEPTAASLAFSLKMKQNSKVLVYDFGGGTIDISVLELQNDVIRVLATAGDIKIGGDDFDIMLTEKLVIEIKDEFNVDLFKDKLALQRIRDEAEKAKKELSTLDEYEINLPFLAESSNGPVSFQRTLKRKEFQDLIAPKVKDTIKICSKALKLSNLEIKDIDEVLLVGGTTRIPCIQKQLKKFFDKEPNKRVNPDEIVALGAAVQGSIAKGESRDILLVDVIAISLGVKTFGDVFTKIIKSNTTIPITKSMVFSTAEDNQTEVEIDVFQGENNKVEKNKLLGKFILGGIQQAPKGEPRIEVSFNIDINGILKVTAIDLSTKNSKEVAVLHSGLLSSEEKEQIREKYEDEKQSEKVEEPESSINLREEINLIGYFFEVCIKNPDIDDQIKDECSNQLGIIKKELETGDNNALEKLKNELEIMQQDIKVILESDKKDKPKEKKKGKKDDTNPFLTIPKDLLEKK
ncbi:MAG: molecular chaperone DnaK [Acidobacteriota bacterium]